MSKGCVALLASVGVVACSGATSKPSPPPRSAAAPPAVAVAEDAPREPALERAPSYGVLGCGGCGGDGYGGLAYGSAFASLAGTGDYDPVADGPIEPIGGGAPEASGTAVSVPSARPGVVDATGALDKAVLRRLIKRHLAQIKYCYEKELLGEPRLAGTVTATFAIDASGRVSRSAASGLHPRVAACVAAVISTIAFPPPRGGGTVDVTYPITFQPDGG